MSESPKELVEQLKKKSPSQKDAVIAALRAGDYGTMSTLSSTMTGNKKSSSDMKKSISDINKVYKKK